MSTLELDEEPRRLDAAGRQALLESVSVQIPPREVTTGYRVGFSLLATAMIAMAVGFTGLVGFLTWLGIWHLYNAVASLSAGPYFLFHLPMALLGLMLVLFLIKPLFFRPKVNMRRIRVLDRQQEPFLFEYVERLCQAVNAPMPDVIRVDCDPNAHAAIETRWFGLGGRKCIVQIGLPLAAAMTVSQLTGILAHELGHLTQQGGMFTSNLVRRMNAFFLKVVFQRDRLDGLLQRLRANQQALGVLLYWLAKACIEPARGVLWLMVLVGELISSQFLRRMEFDADALEAQIYGAGEFEKVSQDLLFLGIASQRAYHRMANSWEQRRLADDYPRLIVDEARFLRANHKELIALLEEQKTRWFDSHPSHSDRVLSVRDLNLDECPPLVQVPQPAEVLFADFGGLCREVTHAMYGDILKENISKASYIPTAQMTEEFTRQSRRFKMLEEFFGGQANVDGPIFPSAAAGQGVADPQQWVHGLVAARQDLARAVVGISATVDKLHEASAKFAAYSAQQDLANLFPHNPRAHAIYRRATRQRNDAARTLEHCRRFTTPLISIASQRFTIALQLAQCPAIVSKMKHGAAATKVIAKYLPLAHRLRDLMPQIETLKQQAMALRILCSAHNHDQPYRPLVDRILSVADFLNNSTQKLRADLERFPYPFEHAVAGISCGKALHEDAAPKNNEPYAVHEYVTTCIDRYYAMAFRVLSQLATVAQAMESSLNLKPLEVPKEPEEAPKRDRDSIKEWILLSCRAAAGLLLLGMLLWFSFDPPSMNMSWGDNGAGSYRPAAFSPSVQHFNRYDPSAYNVPDRTPAPSYNNRAPVYRPPSGAPTFTPQGAPSQVNVPGYQNGPNGPYFNPGGSNTGMPGQPNYPGRPGAGNPYNPPTYTPPRTPTYTPPTYTPPRSPTPGGGGSPGGGFGGRGG